ncbi:hypothetical protein BU23DRAFT_95315 [Bimuria novae-zelandiae CBS 107.79]|uniref:Uncharacterized protein n=1 Tax=Bimuria novae-zelandiae CBS 107.79 TaxID=1447943 RepID=A0A6A5VCX4_9PLEO|nr:hypothetical protein BU23DRAFT_95315 [Bimuria novae-zelandiae CBS 107.79]
MARSRAGKEARGVPAYFTWAAACIWFCGGGLRAALAWGFLVRAHLIPCLCSVPLLLTPARYTASIRDSNTLRVPLRRSIPPLSTTILPPRDPSNLKRILRSSPLRVVPPRDMDRRDTPMLLLFGYNHHSLHNCHDSNNALRHD